MTIKGLIIGVLDTLCKTIFKRLNECIVVYYTECYGQPPSEEYALKLTKDCIKDVMEAFVYRHEDAGDDKVQVDLRVILNEMLANDDSPSK